VPDQLCLAEYGLGHDRRAQAPQAAASRLGARFLEWQVAGGINRSWQECAAHAELIKRILLTGTSIERTGGPESQTVDETPIYQQQGLF
jgi:hypothetical protein